ncbi:paired box protein and transposase domain containing protein [Lasius niger]|uniref:Paired box protein and transposase domain containing protein n=1 Tax=Lasius niger TaxID=67767 RepID=A0A0J7JX79_LASNI|nr:paired box protein and transposase domain containing protein [Lasius niger]
MNKSTRKYTSKSLRQAIALEYSRGDVTEREIARKLSVAPSTVHFWIRRIDGGDGCGDGDDERDSLDDRPKTGRPRKTDGSMDEQIKALITQNPFLSANEIRATLGLPCKVQTVRNRLREAGFKSGVPAKKPFLRDEHYTARLRFALNHLHWDVDRWSNVIFSDEKIFCSYGNGPPRIWRPVGSDRFEERYVSSIEGKSKRFTIPVWGCVSLKGPCLIHRIERKTLNAVYYVDNILIPILVDSGNVEDLVFMQDNSSIHTSKLTRACMENNGIDYMDDYPAKGADINPIENVWGEIERRLSDRFAATEDSLYEMIKDVWVQLFDPPVRDDDADDAIERDDADDIEGDDETVGDNDYIKKLIGSLPNRIETIARKLGGWTKY